MGWFACLHHPTLLNPSRGSWPHRELHRRPPWDGSHAFSARFRRPPRPVRGPMAKSTEGPRGWFACCLHPTLAYPSRGSWPQGELHRKPPWDGSHAFSTPRWRTPRTVHGPIGNSNEGPRGMVLMLSPPLLRRTPCTVRGPRGPPNAPAGLSACFVQPTFGTRFTRFVAPSIGSSTEMPQWDGPHRLLYLASAHPSRGSWPHRELHRRPWWAGSHAFSSQFWRTP